MPIHPNSYSYYATPNINLNRHIHSYQILLSHINLLFISYDVTIVLPLLIN